MARRDVASDSPLQDDDEEVVITSRVSTETRPKRKYSKNRRTVQEFERNASRAVHRFTRSLEAGVREWREATDRSARRRRDGAIRDALENYAKATGKQLRVMSRTPEDVVRAVRSLKLGKVVRRLFPII
jgi:hypothetical protein